MTKCVSCDETKTKEEEDGLFCSECIRIIQDQLSKGFVYTGIGNLRKLRND